MEFHTVHGVSFAILGHRVQCTTKDARALLEHRLELYYSILKLKYNPSLPRLHALQ